MMHMYICYVVYVKSSGLFSGTVKKKVELPHILHDRISYIQKISYDALRLSSSEERERERVASSEAKKGRLARSGL